MSAEDDTARAVALALADEIVVATVARIAAEKRGYDRGMEDGIRRGFELAARNEVQRWAQIRHIVGFHAAVTPWPELEKRRWFVRCPACRREKFPRLDCPDCRQESRQTFGRPVTGEFTGISPHEPSWEAL